MSTRALSKTGDWTFGQGLANYLTKADEVRQNVVTRIKSFKNDWFLDVDANIDWLNILSNKNNHKIILDEIERVTMTTEGVRSITQLEIISVVDRTARIKLAFTTIYDQSFQEEIGILDSE